MTSEKNYNQALQELLNNHRKVLTEIERQLKSGEYQFEHWDKSKIEVIETRIKELENLLKSTGSSESHI